MSKPVKRSTLALNTAALLVLTGASWGVSYLPMAAPWGAVLGLGIAAIKVALVALFFMHLVREGGGVRLAAAAAPFFIALMVALVAADVVTR